MIRDNVQNYVSAPITSICDSNTPLYDVPMLVSLIYQRELNCNSGPIYTPHSCFPISAQSSIWTTGSRIQLCFHSLHCEQKLLPQNPISLFFRARYYLQALEGRIKPSLPKPNQNQTTPKPKQKKKLYLEMRNKNKNVIIL